ncbi:MAG: hypothetical protein EOP07_19895 [Proteobacteria bacterium]|nr:MAG: hypothetical protein EOP07_19895 [Pseudomonadota bacterium]
MIKKLNFLKLLPLVLLAMSLIACDPTHKDKCEWYLVPEPSQINLVPEGWVSLCARNFVINKQKCYLKSTIEFAKAVNGRTFRLSRLKIDETGPYPREVLKISACQAEEAEVERLAKEPKKEESE